MWWLWLTVICLTLLYFRLKHKNNYWLRKGIKQTSPVPIFGDKWGTIITHQISLADLVQKIYKIGENDRYCGAYDFMSPALVLRDPNLIKDILVKDFDHFVDHKRVIPEGSDPIWDKNLFFLTGQEWRDMRSVLTPVFTGAKMRHMFGLITEIAEQFVQYFSIQKEEIIVVEIKDAFSRLTSDVIASTIFGFKTDSLEHTDSEFYKMAKKITDFTDIWLGIRLLGFFIFPKIYKALKIKILSTKISNFFYAIVKDNIKKREKEQVQRPDMINLLMEARESHKLIKGIEISDEDITAQALVFLFAGFDSVSNGMCFMAYELAKNVEIQQRLFDEIHAVLEKGNASYEEINKMEYLDMVLSETLRKWPITPFVNRICTIPYTVEPKLDGEHAIYLKKNDVLFLPIYGLHRDAKYFPDPDKFDPERFNEENKKNILPYTYVPFGAGPRKCIGYRFALLEIKILFFHLLAKFELVVVADTQIPVKISKKSLNMTPEGGLKLGLRRRN